MQGLGVFFMLIALYGCTLLASAQDHYGATGVLQPETGDLGQYSDLVSASIDILPEVTKVLDQLGSASANSRVSDTGFIENVLSSFMPLSKKVYIASAEAEGRPIEQDQISRLNAAEVVMPSVFKFMNRMRSSQFFDKEPESKPQTKSGFSAGTFEFQTAKRTLAPEGSDRYGRYGNMIAATNNLLPVLSEVIKKITTDPDAPNPSDADFIEKMMGAFLPATKEILKAAAKAEGRVVRKEEFDQLDQSKPVMPNVFNFMERLRKSDFYSAGSTTGTQPGFTSGYFKFNDAENSSGGRSDRPRWSSSSSPSSASRLPNYDYIIPKPEGYYEVFKGTSLVSSPSRSSSLPNYEYTI